MTDNNITIPGNAFHSVDKKLRMHCHAYLQNEHADFIRRTNSRLTRTTSDKERLNYLHDIQYTPSELQNPIWGQYDIEGVILLKLFSQEKIAITSLHLIDIQNNKGILKKNALPS